MSKVNFITVLAGAGLGFQLGIIWNAALPLNVKVFASVLNAITALVLMEGETS